jgi:DNA gyrase/topoisomerase IV subunit A
MATNIPPHNLGEVVDALCALIHNPNATVSSPTILKESILSGNCIFIDMCIYIVRAVMMHIYTI